LGPADPRLKNGRSYVREKEKVFRGQEKGGARRARSGLFSGKCALEKRESDRSHYRADRQKKGE